MDTWGNWGVWMLVCVVFHWISGMTEVCILACVAGVLHMQLQEAAWDDAFRADNAAQLAEQCVATGKRARAHV